MYVIQETTDSFPESIRVDCINCQEVVTIDVPEVMHEYSCTEEFNCEICGSPILFSLGVMVKTQSGVIDNERWEKLK